MSKRPVYVVEDEEPIRRASQMMLRIMGYEPLTFEGGMAFLNAAPQLAPGCVLLDIRMPDVDGLEVQRRLVEMSCPFAIVMMSGHGDLGVAASALGNGAIAFVEKPFYRASLERALGAGFVLLENPAAYEAQMDTLRAKVQALDATERAILAQLALGRSNQAAAADIGISLAAVEIGRARLLTHLGAESVNEALPAAFAAGLGTRARTTG